jgi:hypothetical protein
VLMDLMFNSLSDDFPEYGRAIGVYLMPIYLKTKRMFMKTHLLLLVYKLDLLLSYNQSLSFHPHPLPVKHQTSSISSSLP